MIIVECRSQYDKKVAAPSEPCDASPLGNSYPGVLRNLKNFLAAIVRFFRWLGEQKKRDRLISKGICPVHNCDLQAGEAEIRYGLVRLTDAHQDARHELFPCANSWVTGGCYVSETFPKKKEVQYCQECRSAEETWTEDNNS
jgi:hypothetical protein